MPFAFIPRLGAYATLATLALCATPGAARAAETFTATPGQDLEALTQVVLRRTPSLQSDLAAVGAARAEVHQSRILANPQLDLGWNTVPIGDTNPKDLGSPLANVPSYTAGLAYTVPIGKRGPRKDRADALLVAANNSLAASARSQALTLVRTLGMLATTRLRLDGLHNFAEGQRALIVLSKSRLTAGFATPLEVDRLEIELLRIEQQILAAQADERVSLATCAGAVGMSCSTFAQSEDARAFIVAWLERAERSSPQAETRPDIRALAASAAAAAADADLARATKIPDPNIRIGYMHDRFLAAGNQQNSLNLTVTIPLPLFERGQAQVEAAEERRERFVTQRELALRSSVARSTALRDLLTLQKRRQASLEESLPRARAVLRDLEKAASGRLISLTDVIQARRILDELLIQEADTYDGAMQVAIDLITESGGRS